MFYFKINEVPLFIKGSNIVPLDYFPSRMFQEQELKWLFESAQTSNLNLFRVWGGGMYMTDRFYEMADELGMLIWHDMMFSCKFYPMLKPEFIETSEIEVREQAGRLQHFSSIIMWVLNNEGETMFYWRNTTKESQDKFTEQYDSFYIDRLVPIMKEAGINIAENFADSSPTKGVESSDPYVKHRPKNPRDPRFGDEHYYFMDTDCENVTTHPVFRFLSESGFQSEASFLDYKNVSLQQDWG